METTTKNRFDRCLQWQQARIAEEALVKVQLGDARTLLDTTTNEIGVTEQARDVVNSVLLLTQEQVKAYIEDICSMALSAVYGEEYALELEYEIKRNQSEVTLWVLKDGERFPPRGGVGGGVLDVISFALRLALWSLATPRPAPVFVLDEPGRFLSRDKQPLFGDMLKEVSGMLGIQILMVSHSPDLIAAADRAYEVTQDGDGISHVRELER